ncbi:hypothetical protein PSEUBRA_003807 [Kalmanozyma brasiliensis GHG001]|uniref:uncharacterized protein n=1 Tax=Kalmanozyma brasiliensis (strain GHG001) TaxID=1365824 RepID=UPI001CE9E86C|nr:uncharacterized protein PSEUBRA_003807 [Kalmanozyma brasiliensis GHG001]KAF6767294.1 hypothetical protein PSEUBRA_003807 [Kalmanozyma brasiliensis GHG001]
MNCVVRCDNAQPFNCNDAAETCFQDVYSTPFDPTTNVEQIVADGGPGKDFEWVMCIESRLVGTTIQNDTCHLNVNGATVDIDSQPNSAWSKHPIKGKGSMFFAYLAIFLCLTMVIAAAPFEAGRRYTGQLQQLGDGSWVNITHPTQGDGRLQTVAGSPSGHTSLPMMYDSTNMSGSSTDALRSGNKRPTICKGFAWDHFHVSQTAETVASDTVDCRGSEVACTVNITQGIKIATVLQPDEAGARVAGFSPKALASGLEDALPVNEIVKNLTVAQDFKGHVAARAPTMVYEGNFTDCDDGSEKPGRVLAVKRPLSYRLISYDDDE